ncbi:hypothetical protein C488_08697 [Natrinema pellirubrum DSM 15624]|uniref:Uncharacterized protein n=1 Tax=Natrinema pellirubrum (strain DSM 15624 / CIP 106293 / JCM 10476 / NCIMB 786 / 157) TaxID=797303 RepID=L9YNX4_NATP1|nr:hypothetical protein [Natrinema pellirubrum]ELY75925.1 hypothetical protein C488_08697 [Natrinema pellirubrum DSM 15624]
MSQRKPDYVDDTEIDATLDELPTDEAIEATVDNLEANGFDVVVADSTEAALEACLL